MTKTEILAQIKELRKKYYDLINVDTSPEMKQAKADMHRLWIKMQDERKDEISNMKGQIATLLEQAKAMSRPEKVYGEVTPEIKEWLQKYSRAYDHRAEWTIKAVFEGRFVLVHQPGESYTDMSGPHYGPSSCKLVDMTKTSMGYPGEGRGRFDGRFGKEMLRLALAKVADILTEKKS